MRVKRIESVPRIVRVSWHSSLQNIQDTHSDEFQEITDAFCIQLFWPPSGVCWIPLVIWSENKFASLDLSMHTADNNPPLAESCVRWATESVSWSWAFTSEFCTITERFLHWWSVQVLCFISWQRRINRLIRVTVIRYCAVNRFAWVVILAEEMALWKFNWETHNSSERCVGKLGDLYRACQKWDGTGQYTGQKRG